MSARTTYDEVRYSNYPYAQTHPDRLATVAALHGLSTPDPATARVLEIGCGAGGNLMAMATASPGISALGVDLAAEPIAEGRRRSRRSGSRTSSCARATSPTCATGSSATSTSSSPTASTRGSPSRCATTCWRWSTAISRPTASRTSPTTPTPAATCAGRFADAGPLVRGGGGRRARAGRARAGALPLRVGEPRRHEGLVGRAAGEPAPGASPRPRSTSSCTTTSASTCRRCGSRDFAAHAAANGLALRRRRRPHQPAAGPPSRRRRERRRGVLARATASPTSS